MSDLRPLIAGNWKMFGLGRALDDARRLAEALDREPARARVAICAPATLVERLAQALKGSQVIVGGQDLHAEPEGAHTGDISGGMLFDAGARMVIVAHSERRAAYGETNAMAAAKARAALRSNLEPIVCVGETLEEREGGMALDIICSEVRESTPVELAGHPFVMGYEPAWAVGTGRTPTPGQIEEAHATVRDCLVGMMGEAGRAAPILYGGSVRPANAAAIMAVPGVDGALIGGASLKVDEFLAIIRAAD